VTGLLVRYVTTPLISASRSTPSCGLKLLAISASFLLLKVPLSYFFSGASSLFILENVKVAGVVGVAKYLANLIVFLSFTRPFINDSTLCLKKTTLMLHTVDFNPHQPISVIFGRGVAERVIRVCY